MISGAEILDNRMTDDELCAFATKHGISYLDKENILFMVHNGSWYGKRAVITKDNRHVWKEETTEENIKHWLHPKDSDWNERF